MGPKENTAVDEAATGRPSGRSTDTLTGPVGTFLAGRFTAGAGAASMTPVGLDGIGLRSTCTKPIGLVGIGGPVSMALLETGNSGRRGPIGSSDNSIMAGQFVSTAHRHGDRLTFCRQRRCDLHRRAHQSISLPITVVRFQYCESDPFLSESQHSTGTSRPIARVPPYDSSGLTPLVINMREIYQHGI